MIYQEEEYAKVEEERSRTKVQFLQLEK